MESDELMVFDESMRKKRAELGLTQDQVAEKLSVTRQTISNWENRKSYPDFEQLVRISDFYHISIDSLLKGDPELTKSLDSRKVEHILWPLWLQPLIFIIAMEAIRHNFIKGADNITFTMITALFIANIVTAVVLLKMDNYIDSHKMPLTAWVKFLILLFAIYMIIGVITFFTIGHRNMANTMSTTLTIFLAVIAGIFLLFYLAIKYVDHELMVGRDEHTTLLDDNWLNEDLDKENKSNANESEGDNDDKDNK